MKCYLTDKLLNEYLIQGRDILHELGIIFNFENKTIIWQELLVSMKLPNWTAQEFFTIKGFHPLRNKTKRITHMLDTEYKKIKSRTAGSGYTIKLQENDKPYYAESFQIPNIHQPTLKK